MPESPKHTELALPAAQPVSQPKRWPALKLSWQMLRRCGKRLSPRNSSHALPTFTAAGRSQRAAQARATADTSDESPPAWSTMLCGAAAARGARRSAAAAAATAARSNAEGRMASDQGKPRESVGVALIENGRRRYGGGGYGA